MLIGVVMYIARKLFTKYGFRSALRGDVILRNDAAAKFLASRFVDTLRHVACDPRLANTLIADDCNSAVRVRRDGWLRIGQSIPVEDAHEHCYHVVMDKGVVLDLLEAKIYKMKTTKSGDEVILRHVMPGPSNEECAPHVVKKDARFV